MCSEIDYVSITEIKSANENGNSETSSEVDINEDEVKGGNDFIVGDDDNHDQMQTQLAPAMLNVEDINYPEIIQQVENNLDNFNTDTNVQRQVACPMCQKMFALNNIETHADVCVAESQYARILFSSESEQNQEQLDLYQKHTDEITLASLTPCEIKKAVAKVISQVGVDITNQENRIKLIVFRGNCFTDFHYYFKKLWNKRQGSRITIKYAGEDGIDEGGVSREFYTGIYTDSYKYLFMLFYEKTR